MAAALNLDKILVPTDLSEPSERALHVVRALARDFDARITLLHVYRAPAELEAGASANRGGRRQLRSLIQRSLDSIGGRVQPGMRRRPRTAIVEHLQPWRAICSYARDNDYDLIALSTRGGSSADPRLIGSVAERVLQHAHCRVLFVHPDAEAGALTT